MQERKLLSIVIPVYNEESNLPRIYDALTGVVSELDVDREIIFVDDGSIDGTAVALERLAAQDPIVKVIEFARNFGKEIAVSAGIQHCKGDACIVIDADLQHPVDLILEFVRRWRDGAEVVVGVRQPGGGEPFMRRVSSGLYYAAINAISDHEVTPRATDFRLLDRAVIDEFKRFTEHTRMTRALIDWLGFRREFVPFVANERADGEPRYGTVKRIRLAVSSFITHSFFPLKFAGYLGVTITLVSGALGLFIFVERYLLGDPWNMKFTGPAILAVINMFLVGIILSCLGLIALYVANIHREVTNRPLYSVRRTRNLR